MLVFLFVVMVVQINLVVVMSLLPTHMHAMRQSRIVGRRVPVMPGMVARLRLHQTKAEKKKKSQIRRNEEQRITNELLSLTMTELMIVKSF